MSGSLPPRLLYLIIYNPSLKPPPQSAHPDDEDAQEQAHVLFYTANDHAVSKDRVLRQVGLAKALANFTTIFDPRMSCDSVHSQSRRMIMLSPEPNFWIHSCFELENVPRVSKSRKEDKGKAKQKEPVYDYNEASLHDAALRTKLLIGYEGFTMVHGSFTSILDRLGKEALEVQLERFFTVWAWSCEFGRRSSFAEYLGIRVHPLSTQLIPLIDVFEDKLPPNYFPLVLISSCIVASKSVPPQCPPALVRHLLRMLEARTAPRHASSASADPNGGSSSKDLVSGLPAIGQKHARTASRGAFLGVPGLVANVNMDVRKWSWSGYLTFGIGSSNLKSDSDDDPDARTQEPAKDERISDVDNSGVSQVHSGVTIDSQALQDALFPATGIGSPMNDSSSDSTNHIIADEHEPHHYDPVPSTPNASPLPQAGPRAEPPASGRLSERTIDGASPRLPSPSFSELRVQLSSSDPLDTRSRVIRYLCMDNILFALVPASERTGSYIDEGDLAERSVELIDRLKEIVEVEQEKIASAFSSSPVQSVLQKSQHVITTSSQLTYSSVSFSATSWHLHEGRKALELHPDLLEVYSRGQNPQDWHLAKRGFGGNVQGDVYMEIGRKEASLVDVDSEILGVLRRFVE